MKESETRSQVVLPVLKDWLASEMSDISESNYCAGWLDGLEYSLWSCILSAEAGDTASLDGEVGVPFGMSVIPTERLLRMRDVANIISGWIAWVDEDTGFVPMEEWLKMYAATKPGCL